MPDPENFQIRDGNGDLQTFTPNADPAKGAKQDALLAALNLVGTRKYGEPVRVSVTATSTLSSPIAATEVMLVASVKQYVLVVAATGTPAVSASTGIPLEAGEKFHMRMATGLRIATIRDAADGFLHIVPIVP